MLHRRNNSKYQQSLEVFRCLTTSNLELKTEIRWVELIKEAFEQIECRQAATSYRSYTLLSETIKELEKYEISSVVVVIKDGYRFLKITWGCNSDGVLFLRRLAIVGFGNGLPVKSPNLCFFNNSVLINCGHPRTPIDTYMMLFQLPAYICFPITVVALKEKLPKVTASLVIDLGLTTSSLELFELLAAQLQL